jgi:hypothetical protein
LPDSTSRRLFALLFTLLALAVPVALLGCGGGDDEGGENDKSATSLIEKSFKQKIESADVKLDLEVKLDGIEQVKDPIKVSLKGPFESGGGTKLPSLDWALDVAAQGQTFNAGLVSTGDNAFVRFQGSNYEVGEEQIKQINSQLATANRESKKQSLEDLGVKPTDWLEGTKEEGDEQVAGVKTTHISGGIDMGRFIEDLNDIVKKAPQISGAAKPSTLTEEQKNQIRDIVKDPRFDAYVGEDDVLRRLSADLEFSVPEGDRKEAGGLEGGSISFSLEFAEVGQPQQIAAPSGAKPISELAQQLGGLLGGLGGLGGGLGQSPGQLPQQAPSG